jgi:hypothetical protein
VDAFEKRKPKGKLDAILRELVKADFDEEEIEVEVGEAS